ASKVCVCGPANTCLRGEPSEAIYDKPRAQDSRQQRCLRKNPALQLFARAQPDASSVGRRQDQGAQEKLSSDERLHQSTRCAQCQDQKTCKAERRALASIPIG